MKLNLIFSFGKFNYTCRAIYCHAAMELTPICWLGEERPNCNNYNCPPLLSLHRNFFSLSYSYLPSSRVLFWAYFVPDFCHIENFFELVLSLFYNVSDRG